TYALLEERVPPAPTLDRDQAIVELVRRYLASHGPATARDFAWWSGLTIGDFRRGIEALGATKETVDGRDYFFFPTDPPAMPSAAYLLPNYDEYTVAYRDRAVYADVPVPFDHAVVEDGRVVGTWRRTITKQGVRVEPYVPEAAERYARFL